MQIPKEFHGTWSGWVHDRNRKKSYQGKIEITEVGVATGYEMARGTTAGNVIEQTVSPEGVLVFNETVGSWSGTLLLYLGLDGELKCVWRNRSTRLWSESSMTR